MGKRGTRRTIATGVYADRYGVDLVVKRGGTPYTQRAPLGLDKREYIRRRTNLLAHVLNTEPSAAPKGTFAYALDRYAKIVRHLAGWQKQLSHLRACLPALGQKDRAAITRQDILTLRADWIAAGAKPKTINNRLSALRALYHALDGDDAPTPADRIKPLTSHRTPPHRISVDLIQAVDLELQRQEQRGYLHDAKTRARFRVLATTGARASEIMRAQPSDVDLDHRLWRTRDGKGGFRPIGIPLTSEAIEAWQLFIAADAWGLFNTNSFARTLRTSGWPKTVRPYQLRHTIGLALTDADVDLADVGSILGHRPGSKITSQHYVPPQWKRMVAAMQKIDQRVQWVTPEGDTRRSDTPRKHTKKHELSRTRLISRKQRKVG